MSQELEPQVRPDDRGPRVPSKTRAFWAASIVALVVVAALLVIGFAGVLSAGDEGSAALPTATSEAPVPSAASAVPASPAALENIVFLDVRDGGTRLVSRSIRSIVGAQDFQVSPDGSELAFGSQGQIFVANIDGAELRQVTEGPGSASDPAWSPDGSEIVFEWSNPREGRTNLFVVDVVSRVRRQITFSSGREFREAGAAIPSFSPDGRRIVFTAMGGGGRWLGLWTVPTAGGTPKLLIENAAYGAFSPDGTTIAYHRIRPRESASDWWVWTPAIRLADADGTHPRRLLAADGGSYSSALTWEHTRLVWSPDGSHLACACGGGVFHGYPDGNVRVYDAVTGDRSIVGTGREPSWLDDRTLIVADFMPASPDLPPLGLTDVSFVDLRTGEARPLPKSIRSIAGVGHFRVSPDGAEIAFDDGSAIFVANVDGTHILRFSRPGGVSAPDWSPDGGTIVFGHGASVLLLDIATGDFTRIIREPHRIWAPNFGPDGRTILYTGLRGDRLTLRTVPATGGPSSLLLTGAFGSYSPDGTTIAFRKTSFDGDDPLEMTSGTIWLVDADGRHAREIGHSCCWQSQIDPDALWPTWSPDGTKVAFQPLYGSTVKVVDVGRDRQRSVGEGVDPSWLDDGTLIVSDFDGSSPEVEPRNLADIAFIDVRTGKAKQLSKDIRSIPGIRHLRASPDGTMIAFEDGESIFVANIDGTHLRRFTPKLGVSAPSWSPDGSRLVFSEGNIALTLDIDTGRASTLVRERGTIWYPNFSPDGETVLYTTVRHGALTLRTIPATGGWSAPFARGAFGAYSPDGTTIAFRKTQFDGIDVTDMTAGTLWLADADGSHVRGLAHCGCWMSHIDPEALWPMWSPDGSLIAYQPFYQSPIRVIDVRSGHIKKVGEGDDPSWLGDHTLIIADFKEVRS